MFHFSALEEDPGCFHLWGPQTLEEYYHNADKENIGIKN